MIPKTQTLEEYLTGLTRTIEVAIDLLPDGMLIDLETVQRDINDICSWLEANPDRARPLVPQLTVLIARFDELAKALEPFTRP